jgi:hypothetical protein
MISNGPWLHECWGWAFMGRGPEQLIDVELSQVLQLS